MRVLVTGAQGCIGSWVVKTLVDRGIDVVLFDADPSPSRLKFLVPPERLNRIPVETGLVQDTARVKALVRDSGITHIVHLAAALIPFCQANPVEGAMINALGTLSLFEAARDAGRPVRIVYASSAAVWGPEEAYSSGWLTEADPLKPATHYGVFKQCNEGNARVFYASNGISSVGLRPWSVYGLGRDRGLTADPTLAIRALVDGETFRIRLSGSLDLQYVEDVAETFVRCLMASLEGAFVFNLKGAVISVDEFVATLAQVRPEARHLISFEGPKVPVASRMDDSELRSKIPDIPRTPLQQGIRKTIFYFEQLKLRACIGSD